MDPVTGHAWKRQGVKPFPGHIVHDHRASTEFVNELTEGLPAPDNFVFVGVENEAATVVVGNAMGLWKLLSGSHLFEVVTIYRFPRGLWDKFAAEMDPAHIIDAYEESPATA